MSINRQISAIILLVAAIVAIISGCTSNNYQTFQNDDISLQYPGNWREQPNPTNDDTLANKSGFKIMKVFLEGKGIEKYTFYMGVAVGNITNSNLTEAADRIYNNFILKEADYTPIITRTTLKNSYEVYIYTYNGTGASSSLTIYEKTYIFTKDYKTVYYVMFATPRSNLEENQNIMQNIMDSVTIK
jgi:hypothetical protein